MRTILPIIPFIKLYPDYSFSLLNPQSMDNDIIDTKDLVFSQKEEPYTSPRQSFAKLFAEANLDPLANSIRLTFDILYLTLFSI